jgi:hypothetical protein
MDFRRQSLLAISNFRFGMPQPGSIVERDRLGPERSPVRRVPVRQGSGRGFAPRSSCIITARTHPSPAAGVAEPNGSEMMPPVVRCRPPFRNGVAHKSGIISCGIGRLCIGHFPEALGHTGCHGWRCTQGLVIRTKL